MKNNSSSSSSSSFFWVFLLQFQVGGMIERGVLVGGSTINRPNVGRHKVKQKISRILGSREEKKVFK